MRLADAGNTLNPALSVLLAKGYTVKLQILGNDEPGDYWAFRDGHEFVSESPLSLLGLIGIYEHYGENWQARLDRNLMDDLPTFHYYIAEDDNGESYIVQYDDEE